MYRILFCFFSLSFFVHGVTGAASSCPGDRLARKGHGQKRKTWSVLCESIPLRGAVCAPDAGSHAVNIELSACRPSLRPDPTSSAPLRPLLKTEIISPAWAERTPSSFGMMLQYMCLLVYTRRRKEGRKKEKVTGCSLPAV